jgi:hypothetical protein
MAMLIVCVFQMLVNFVTKNVDFFTFLKCVHNELINVYILTKCCKCPLKTNQIYHFYIQFEITQGNASVNQRILPITFYCR